MIKLRFHKLEVEKGISNTTFFTLKNVLVRNITNEYTKGCIIHHKDSNIKFEILSVNFYENIKEGIEKTGYEKFQAGNSIKDVINYYKRIGNHSENSKWKSIVFELKIIKEE